MLNTKAPAYHWYHMTEPDARISILESGMGTFPDVALNTDNHFAILLISASRVESLADADCEEKDRNAIVASIAKITITTMSSTRVKALGLLLEVYMAIL